MPMGTRRTFKIGSHALIRARASQLRLLMARHRTRVFDSAFLLIVASAALFYCFEVDVFANGPGEGTKAYSLELDEVLLLSAIFCGGLVIFALRRLSD